MRDYASSEIRGESQSRLALVLVTLFLSLVLEFLPWPLWTLQYKPLFPDLALIYWVINSPRTVNYAAAVGLGVMMDVAGRLPLGFTAMSYTAVVLLANGMRGRFSLLGPLAQAVHVLIVLSFGQFVLFMLQLLDGGSLSQFTWHLFAPSASASMLWLLMPILMRRLSTLLSGRRQHD